MKLFVTGGLGFIGSNFVRLLLEDDSVEYVVNLDKVTYAGNPENLADLEDDPRYVFVQGDLMDGELTSRLLAEHGIAAIVALGMVEGGADERRMIRQAWRRGRKAAWLSAADWETLLARPLEEVREELRLGEAPRYEPLRSEGAPPLA